MGMTAEEEQEIVWNLVRWEGRIQWLYRDSLGYPTVGIGNLVKTVADSEELPWRVADGAGSGLATNEAVRDDYARVQSLPPSLKPVRYRVANGLYLSDEEIDSRCVRRLREEFIPALIRIFPAFESFPFPAREALVDMIYGLGEGREPTADKPAKGLRMFRVMRQCCEERDWEGAARSCNVRTRRDERNEWVRGKFREASK